MSDLKIETTQPVLMKIKFREIGESADCGNKPRQLQSALDSSNKVIPLRFVPIAPPFDSILTAEPISVFLLLNNAAPSRRVASHGIRSFLCPTPFDPFLSPFSSINCTDCVSVAPPICNKTRLTVFRAYELP